MSKEGYMSKYKFRANSIQFIVPNNISFESKFRLGFEGF